MSEPWNLTEPLRRQLREAQAEAKRTEPPSKSWRVQRVGSVYEDFRSQNAAYTAVKGLSSLGIELKVWHFESGEWRLYEHIEPQGGAEA